MATLMVDLYTQPRGRLILAAIEAEPFPVMPAAGPQFASELGSRNAGIHRAAHGFPLSRE